ncbi:MAG: TetR/AcrR family transcriptional regulator [Acidimicrobiia bacterium]
MTTTSRSPTTATEPAELPDAGSSDRRPGRPRDARVEHAILEAAIELAMESGNEAVTVDAVAQRAKVSKASLYRRWPTKEAMLLDAWRLLSEPFQPSPPDTGSLAGDLDELADIVAAHIGDERFAKCMPDLLAAARRNPELAPIVDTLLLERSERITSIFDRAIERGEIAADTDVDYAHDLLIGPLFLRASLGKPVEERHVRLAVVAVLAAVTARR